MDNTILNLNVPGKMSVVKHTSEFCYLHVRLPESKTFLEYRNLRSSQKSFSNSSHLKFI